MKDINDIARLEYVLSDYDDVAVIKSSTDETDSSKEFKDKNNNPAPMVLYSKKINGTYYVAEAVVDSKYKKLWVTSAYISKKDTVTQVSDDKNTPEFYARDALASPVSDNSISQRNNAVNAEYDISDAQYSIAYTTENKPVAVIDDDILQGVDKADWVKTVKNAISGNFPNGIAISGRLIKVNKKTGKEYTNSKYSKNLKANNGTVYEDKFKSANNIDDIVLASTNYINEDLKHARKDNFTQFARGDVLIRVGQITTTPRLL